MNSLSHALLLRIASLAGSVRTSKNKTLLVQKTSPKIHDAVALVISFRRNNNRSKCGFGGGNIDTDKLEAIISLHLTADYDNDSSNNKYLDDDNESLEFFESVTDPNDRKIDDDNEFVVGASIIINEIENNNKYDGYIIKGNDEDNDNNDNSENSGKEDIVSSRLSTASVTESNDNNDGDTTNASWMSMVTIVCNNVDNSIDSNIVDNSPFN